MSDQSTPIAREKEHFIVSEDIAIRQPKKRFGIVIAHDDWEYLKKEVGAISKPSKLALIYQTIGPILLGISLTKILAIVTIWYNNPTRNQDEFWTTEFKMTGVIGMAAFILGCLFLLLAHTQRKVDAAGADNILGQMELIGKKYPEGEDAQLEIADGDNV